jgi:hypothetical protein
VKTRIYILFIILFFGNVFLYAQENKETPIIVKDSSKTSPSKINPLAPAKAAFYSAILPGLGQAYNKKYWKIPIVYGALGTGIYFYSINNKEYKRFRNAYKQRLLGQDDEFKGQYNDATLINGQKVFQRNRDLSLMITIGLYILNIVEANVNAHLMQFNVNDNLSFQPAIFQNEINYKQNIGLTLNYNFK